MDKDPSARHLLLLALSGGVLLGIAYPPSPVGVTALIGFVPLFFLLEQVRPLRAALSWGYLTFFVLNLITLYWAGGFTHMRDGYLMTAGALLLLAHPVFFTLSLLPFVWIRNSFGFLSAVVSFPLVFTAFEFCHSSSQMAFPWLLLANSQTYDLNLIQMASATGAYGVSFWVVTVNVVCFLLVRHLSARRPSTPSGGVLLYAIVLAAIVFVPEYIGKGILAGLPAGARGDVVTVASVQPNIDPFEKWLEAPSHFLPVLEDMTRKAASGSPDLVIWPETAVPTYILFPSNAGQLAELRRLVDSIRIPLLTGIADVEFSRGGARIPLTAVSGATGEERSTYNSSMLLIPGQDSIQKYAKIVLAPFAERVPYSDALSFLNAARWNFGLGGWSVGHDTTLFTFRTRKGREVRFSNLICYESAFPGFTAGFVRKGAEFLTVITNDSWWGNTSGTYQHSRIAILRAVENRRWVVQCANGGISEVVDPAGRTISATGMYTAATLVREIVPLREMSFYTRHGDWFAEWSLMLAVFITGAALAQQTYRSYRRSSYDGNNRSAE